MQANHTLQHQPVNHSTLPNADWAALRLLSLYRLFLLVAFAAVFYLSELSSLVGSNDPTMFRVTHLVYLIFALICNYMIRNKRQSLEIQLYSHVYLDMILLAVIIHTSGGVQSGLGILMLIPIAVLTHSAKPRYAFLFAAIASVTVISQEIYTQYAFGASHANFPQTALLGGMLFVVALITSVILPANGLGNARESRPLSIRQITELNSQIIKELESGVLYVDSDNHVQLANETSRDMLGMEGLDLPCHIGKACDQLFVELKLWRNQPAAGNRSFGLANGALEILPYFTKLNNGGTLIKLEDHRHIRQQVQQLKLASLGRLSASIAHEIRNPLGAISNAVQLLGESSALSSGDSRLLDIAENHTRRINRIVEDVLLLSNRQVAKTESISLNSMLDEFQERFTAQNTEFDYILECNCSDSIAWFDTDHLDQILWNLCSNSIVHNEGHKNLLISINVHPIENSALLLEVQDNGKGIGPEERANLFEPFYTTNHSGTGLGLYIIRELCELNQASIEYVSLEHGACFRLSLPQTRAMAA